MEMLAVSSDTTVGLAHACPSADNRKPHTTARSEPLTTAPSEPLTTAPSEPHTTAPSEPHTTAPRQPHTTAPRRLTLLPSGSLTLLPTVSLTLLPLADPADVSTTRTTGPGSTPTSEPLVRDGESRVEVSATRTSPGLLARG